MEFKPAAAAGLPINEAPTEPMHKTVDAVYRSESRRVLATLIRLLGDFDLAEDALHDAFAATVEQCRGAVCPIIHAHGSFRANR